MCHFSLCYRCANTLGSEGGEGTWVSPDTRGLGRAKSKTLHSAALTDTLTDVFGFWTHWILTFPSSAVKDPCCLVAKAKCDSWAICWAVVLYLAMVLLKWAYTVPPAAVSTLEIICTAATNAAAPAQHGSLLFQQLSTWEDFKSAHAPF